MSEYADQFCSEIQGVVRREIRDACRQAEHGAFWELGPYDQLSEGISCAIMALGEAQRQVLFLKTHTHEWNDNDRCIHCGADWRS